MFAYEVEKNGIIFLLYPIVRLPVFVKSFKNVEEEIILTLRKMGFTVKLIIQLQTFYLQMFFWSQLINYAHLFFTMFQEKKRI